MSLNKQVLAVAIVSGLFATAANAAVNLAANPANPVSIASEVNITSTAPVTFTNKGALDLVTPTSYAFSAGEVRYARIECAPHVRFAANSTVAYDDNGGADDAAALGAINGLGTNAIHFSVTAKAAGVGDNAKDSFTVKGDRVLTSNAAADCTYSLYDQPSQAAAGGATGRIAQVSGQYLASESAYDFRVLGTSTATANVEVNPSFTSFVLDANTNSTATARLAQLQHIARQGDQIKANGTDTTLADIMGANTSLQIDGDFSFVRNDDGTYTGAALKRVYLSAAADCSTEDSPATSLTATRATWTLGANEVNGNGQYFCVEREGTPTIPVTEFTARLVAVSAAPTTYSVQSTGPLASGSIVRNGTQLQAPLVQLPSGYISRIALTNTGSVARPYTITVQGEAGNTISTDGANMSGSVPANGTVVIELPSVLTGFTGAPRATVNVTVAGPNNQIQGLYQIVNPANGSISNHVMVRPGLN